MSELPVALSTVSVLERCSEQRMPKYPFGMKSASRQLNDGQGRLARDIAALISSIFWIKIRSPQLASKVIRRDPSLAQ